MVDDASTDGTEEIFKECDNDKIRYFRYDTNRGACYARNFGVDKAIGKYIAFQDSDDLWKSDKLEKQLAYMKKNNLDFCFCGMNRVDPVNGGEYYYPGKDFDEKKDAVEQFLDCNMASTQTIMVKRDVMDIIKFDVSFKRFQDWDFSLQAALAGLKMGYLKKALVDSVVQGNSITAMMNSGKAYEHLFAKYEEYYKKYPKIESEIYLRMGTSFKKTDRKKTKKYLRRSQELKWDIKTAIKIILYTLHIW